ncbi:MAG: sugar ABC transporter substrate-binding protein [Acidimicrobiia bacterium]|nr:sugar ABC transporter substrate-binding protein [Acidimicrobiia bacterium]
MRKRLSGSAAARISALAVAGSLAVSALAPVTVAAQDYEPPPSDIEATLEIQNWGNPEDIDWFKGIADGFREKYPNVTIEDNFVPITTWADYINTLVAQVASGNAPDVINIAIEGVKFGVEKDMFLPLDDYLSSDPAGAELLADVDQPLIDALADENGIYLIPWQWNSMLMHYNTKMFEEAGIPRPSDDWTWDDFLAIAQQLTTGEGEDKVWGYCIQTFLFGITPWFFSNGTSHLNEDWTAPNLTDPKMIESVSFIRSLIDEHGVSPAFAGTDAYQLFPASKCAMTGAGHWTVGPNAAAGFEDYDVLPWPQKEQKATVFGSAGFGIHPSSQNQDLAWEYVKELTSQEASDSFARRGASNPARRSSAQLDEWLAFPESAELFFDSIEYAIPIPSPRNQPEVETIFMRHIGDILAGNVEPEAGLLAAQQELEPTFE